MKKTISLILALLMLVSVLSLSSCGKAEPEKKYEAGTTTGNIYRNDYLGITFTKPDTWKYFTDEEIAQVMGVAKDMLKDGENFSDSYLTSLVEFMALEPNEGCNVNLTVEKLKGYSGKNTDIDAYVDAFKKMLPGQYDENVAKVNISDTVTEKKIGENTYRCLRATVQIAGGTMEQEYLLRIVDSYVVAICITAVGGVTIEAMEAMLS